MESIYNVFNSSVELAAQVLTVAVANADAGDLAFRQSNSSAPTYV